MFYIDCEDLALDMVKMFFSLMKYDTKYLFIWATPTSFITERSFRALLLLIWAVSLLVMKFIFHHLIDRP
jgi:hypothetical protein